MKPTSLALLKRLTEAHAVSGDESEVRRIFLEELRDSAEVFRDRMGGIIFRKEGAAPLPRVMLAAHTDEIGFMVRSITKEGFLRFVTIGGWWNHIIPGTRVHILTPEGKVPGLMGSKPPHLLKPSQRKEVMELEDMAVDIGASSDEEAGEMGVRPGQWIAPEGAFFSMKKQEILAGKAFDDRAGCALMIETMKDVEGFPGTLFGAATVQEEVGLRGARPAAEIVDPDVCIVLEGSPAADSFGNDGSDRQGVLGEGVQIRLFDPTMIPNPGLRDFMLDLAESENIPYQVLVRDAGGTDAGQIHLHGQGVPTIVLAVPVRYAHSPTGFIHADDYDNALALVKAAVMKLDAATVAGFVA
jgi:putative aminopeptidase FrvX